MSRSMLKLCIDLCTCIRRSCICEKVWRLLSNRIRWTPKSMSMTTTDQFQYRWLRNIRFGLRGFWFSIWFGGSWLWGSNSVLNSVHAQFPDKDIIFQSLLSVWNDSVIFQTTHRWYDKYYIGHCKQVLPIPIVVWNLMLEMIDGT